MSDMNLTMVALAYVSGKMRDGGKDTEHLTEFFEWLAERDDRLIEQGTRIAEGRLSGKRVEKW